MEVTCPHCKVKLNVPNDRLPADQVVRINCPRCKNRITIEPPEGKERGRSLNEAHSEIEKAVSENTEQGKEDEIGAGDESLDFYDEGTRLALVLADEAIKPDIQSAVEELGYRYIPVFNTRDALSKLRFHSFDLVFLADGFDGQEIESSPVTNYLNHLSMSSRRKIFFALFGDRFRTMDEMKAYALSANLVINPKDQDKLAAVFRRGIAEYERFYKVFNDTLVELGKA